jgi:hypothetical protein
MDSTDVLTLSQQGVQGGPPPGSPQGVQDLGDGFQACDLAVAYNETCQVGQDDELWHDLTGHTAAVQREISEACQHQQGPQIAIIQACMA